MVFPPGQLSRAMAHRLLSIRGHLAVSGQSDTPLNWMNVCIDAVASNARASEDLFNVLQRVMAKCRQKYEQVKQVFKIEI